MTEEKLYINRIPISELGVLLAENSYSSVLQWGSMKQVNFNDWAEYDSIEPDLFNPTINSRTVTINFHAKGIEGYEMFLDFLTIHSENEFYFAELGFTIKLRVTQNSLRSANGNWQSFSITFSDDTPQLSADEVLVPETDMGDTGFTIDGKDFARYGITVLNGTLQGIRQTASIKQRLVINETSKNGVKYDILGGVNFKDNNFIVKILLRSETLKKAVDNYYSLFKEIIKPLARVICIKQTMEVLEVFYHSSSCHKVHKQLTSGMAGIAFDITFTLISRGIITALSDDNAVEILSGGNGCFLTLK